MNLMKYNQYKYLTELGKKEECIATGIMSGIWIQMKLAQSIGMQLENENLFQTQNMFWSVSMIWIVKIC